MKRGELYRVFKGNRADCDELMSLSKSQLTRFTGVLSPAVLAKLDHALKAALALD